MNCFNCGGPHHLRFCPKPRDQATIDKNRATHPTGSSQRQPTGFRGRHAGRPYTRPTKWRLPEEAENNKRVIDNKPYTFNPTNKRWEPDTTPDSGQQQLPAVNIVPPTTPSAAQPPSPSPLAQPPKPTAGDMKGAFFAGGYGPSSNLDGDTQKQMLALHMKYLQEQWENM
jgi:hypothetical protein